MTPPSKENPKAKSSSNEPELLPTITYEIPPRFLKGYRKGEIIDYEPDYRLENKS